MCVRRRNLGQGKFGPLSGTLPDMTSDTESYVRLQTVYKRKAEADLQSFSAHLGSRLSSIGRPLDQITLDEIEIFCKNIRNLS
eukprot:12277181-Prorocentrum_lima.AAC.1